MVTPALVVRAFPVIDESVIVSVFGAPENNGALRMPPPCATPELPSATAVLFVMRTSRNGSRSSLAMPTPSTATSPGLVTVTVLFDTSPPEITASCDVSVSMQNEPQT